MTALHHVASLMQIRHFISNTKFIADLWPWIYHPRNSNLTKTHFRGSSNVVKLHPGMSDAHTYLSTWRLGQIFLSLVLFAEIHTIIYDCIITSLYHHRLYYVHEQCTMATVYSAFNNDNMREHSACVHLLTLAPLPVSPSILNNYNCNHCILR